MTDPAAPTTEAPCYRWEPIKGDCIRHHGPHEGFRCNGAYGRLIEVFHERDAARREAVDFIRREVGLDPGWEQRVPGLDQINPFDLDYILKGMVTPPREHAPRGFEQPVPLPKATPIGTNRMAIHTSACELPADHLGRCEP